MPFGQPVRLVNLGAAGLNGTHAVLGNYVEDTGRFAVQLLEGPLAGHQKFIKPCNITYPDDD